MTQKTHNGYTNFETWTISLRIDNDEIEQEYWRQVAAETLDNAENDTSEFKRSAQGVLADTLKEHFETDWENVVLDFVGQAGLYRDLMANALGRVNWYEVAQSLLEDLAE